MIGARRLSEEAWPLSPKSWQEPVPFGMHRSIQEGRDGLKCFRVPCHLELSPVTEQLEVLCTQPGKVG